MSKDFRKLPKESLEICVPIDLATKFRERIARERSTITRSGTEAICVFMGVDPSNYGIVQAEESVA